MEEKYLETEKEKFTEPEIEIVRFGTTDIVTTSVLNEDEDEMGSIIVG